VEEIMASPLRTVISPSRYVQGKGAIHQLGEYLKPIGSTPLIVADDLVWGLVGHDLEASLTAAGLPVQREVFNGIPSARARWTGWSP
jgi:glycerol dehydrogenase